MRLYVQFELDVPDDMPLEDAQEWVSFEVGEVAQLKPRHPQMKCDLDAIMGTVCVRS